MVKYAKMFADGGARGNPGPAAGGAVLYATDADGNVGEPIAEVGKYLPHATNNVAEYTGIIIGLQKARELGIDVVDVNLDSELAVKQINGQYKVKNPDLGKLFLEVYNLRQQFKKTTFTHVRREFNKAADAMVNKTIDTGLGL